ncbi:MAG: hypothetical protein ACJA2W_003455 [Planctomycetota bacterium]|jgi:hypothetical protein
MSDNKPKPIPRKTPGDQAPSGKKKGGMTMREQIAARKNAETGDESAKPAAKTAGAAGDEKPERAARPSSRSGARKGGSSRGARSKDEGNDDSGGTTRGRRARSEPKKKSPVPIIAVAVIVLGGAGAYFGGVFDGDKAEAAEPADTTTAGADGDSAAENTLSASGEMTDGEIAAGDAATADGDADGDAAADDSGAGEAAADAPAEDAAKAEAKAKAAEDESEEAQAKAKTDMSNLKPFGKPPGATDEQWATLQEKAGEFFDPFAGAAGGRAQKKLIEAGQLAWPAILNEMIKLDVDDPEGNRMGFRAADALDRARGSDTGRALDWRTSQNSSTGEMKAKDLFFNKRLIILHHDAWMKVLEDPAHWAKFDKTDAATEAIERAKAKAAKATDEFDDLDLGDIEID